MVANHDFLGESCRSPTDSVICVSKQVDSEEEEEDKDDSPATKDSVSIEFSGDIQCNMFLFLLQ